MSLPRVGVDLAFNTDTLTLGANAGAGARFNLTESLRAFEETKYIFSSSDGLAIMGGVSFQELPSPAVTP
jgi:hypothetical protein